MKIKHAVNCSNVSTSLTLSSGRVLTVDQALVVMAQLSQRKQQLDILRKRQPKARNNDHYGRSGATEYTCINYDLTDDFGGNHGNSNEARPAEPDGDV